MFSCFDSFRHKKWQWNSSGDIVRCYASYIEADFCRSRTPNTDLGCVSVGRVSLSWVLWLSITCQSFARGYVKWVARQEQQISTIYMNIRIGTFLVDSLIISSKRYLFYTFCIIYRRHDKGKLLNSYRIGIRT